MAILARLAFDTPVSLADIPYEGIEHLTADDLEYARELGLGLKLIGTAERVDGGLSVRVHPAFLYGAHPLASINGPFNAVTIESPAITEITLSGPGAGGPQTASAVLGDVISAMIPPASTPEPSTRLKIVADVTSAFYLHVEVADEPGVLAQLAQILGLQGISVKSFVQKGLGTNARLVMVVAPGARVPAVRGGRADRRAGVRALTPARDPRHRRGVLREPVPGLIERYRDRLPFAADDPVVSLQEGSTPLVPAPRLSDRVGAEVFLKIEGANPTGSFKDRGMTCAVSATRCAAAPRPCCAPRPATPPRRCRPTRPARASAAR